MTSRRFLLFLLLAIPFAGAVSFGEQSRFKVLALYSDHAEPDHVQFAKEAVKVLTERAASEHFTVEVTNRWGDRYDDDLNAYQLIIWRNEQPIHAVPRR